MLHKCRRHPPNPQRDVLCLRREVDIRVRAGEADGEPLPLKVTVECFASAVSTHSPSHSTKCRAPHHFSLSRFVCSCGHDSLSLRFTLLSDLVTFARFDGSGTSGKWVHVHVAGEWEQFADSSLENRPVDAGGCSTQVSRRLISNVVRCGAGRAACSWRVHTVDGYLSGLYRAFNSYRLFEHLLCLLGQGYELTG